MNGRSQHWHRRQTFRRNAHIHKLSKMLETHSFSFSLNLWPCESRQYCVEIPFYEFRRTHGMGQKYQLNDKQPKLMSKWEFIETCRTF